MAETRTEPNCIFQGSAEDILESEEKNGNGREYLLRSPVKAGGVRTGDKDRDGNISSVKHMMRTNLVYKSSISC
jgi:hypothetical protein